MIKEIKTKLSSFEIFTIFRNEENSFILDSAMDKKKLGRFSFISSNPFKVLKYKNTLNNPLDNLQEELKKYKVENKTHLPFIGGAVGYLSYDLGNYIEKLPRTAIDDTNVYDLYFGLYNWVIVVDHLENKTYIATPDLDIEEENKIIRKIEDQINEAERAGIDSICYEEKDVEKTRLKSNFTKSEFEDAVRKVQDYIRQGDIYQANLTQRFSGKTTLSSYELYRDLRRFSPAPFGAFLNFEHSHILSNSPERFIKCVDNKVETRPIKGTRPRGKTESEDLALEKELLSDEKELAEHNMLVDLGRNDIGKISEIGSVNVDKYLSIERFSHVMHIGSTVTGTLRKDLDSLAAIDSILPAGTLSGAPKIRACEIINELENNKRGIYGGAIGYIDLSGNVDTCISIRIAFARNNKVFIRSGAGIVADSVPDNEFDECLNKAAAVIDALKIADGGIL